MEYLIAATIAGNIILGLLAVLRTRSDRIAVAEAVAYRAGHADGYRKAWDTRTLEDHDG